MNGIPKSVVDWVEKLVNETVQVLKDEVEDLHTRVDELVDVVEDNYRHSIELAQECANEIRDTTDSEIEELSSRIDELEDEDDG